MPASHGRSKGIHISVVIRDYALATGALDKKWGRQDIDEDDTTLMQIGLAFENYLRDSNQHAEIDIHFGELSIECGFCAWCAVDKDCHELEGCGDWKPAVIFMTPDGISFPGDYSVIDWFKSKLLHMLHEIKFTKKSCRDFLEIIRLRGKKARMWLWQIQCYLKAMGSLAAKLHVCFVNGNYSYKTDDPDGGSVYIIYWLEFTEEEIESTWDLLMIHTKGMILDGKL
jgi:hypothetical protein